MLLAVLILIPLAAILLMVGLKYWREVTIGVFIWLLFEGAVRKWLLPQYQAPILLLKDIALAAAYCGYLLAPRQAIPSEDKLKAMAILCGALTGYCALEILNPALPTPLLALYGLKNYLMYIPLLFVVPEICRTREQVNKTVFWICVLTIPLCLLALYQFSQPGTAWINKYVSHEAGGESVASLFGAQGEGEFRYGRARTSSTFSYIGGFTTYLLLAMPILSSVLLAARGRNRETLIAAAALALTVGAAFTTGSRTPVYIMVAAAPLLMVTAGSKGLLPLGVAMRLAAVTALVAAASYWLFSDAASAFLYRAENADSGSARLLSPITETVGAFMTSPVFGFGVGSNSNAAASLAGADLYWLNGNVFELEPARVMQDLGLMGFVLVYVVKIYLVLLVLKYLLWSRSKMFVALHMATLAFLLPHIVLFTINNPTGGVIYWALGGFSVAIHRLERRERSAMMMMMQQAPQTAPPPRHAAIA